MRESRTLEYKESVTNTFLKTVSAFSNYDGGKIIFGITDDGKTVGIQNPEQCCLDIENKINDSITPQPDYELSISDNNTVILNVHAGTGQPYLYKSKAYKRNDTATIEVDHTELARLILKGSGRRYEELPSDIQNLTFERLETDLKLRLGVDRLDSNILKTLSLFSDRNGYNNAAAVLSDRNMFSGIDMAKFGDSISIIHKRQLFEHISALSLYDSAFGMFRDYYEYELIDVGERKIRYTVPAEAFREAVANSLIHRQWDMKEHIRILMFDDRIEIISPGGLPPEMTKEAYVSGNFSTLRNPIIGGVFFRLGLVEIFGTGVRRIKETYRDSIVKPEFEADGSFIKVTLPVIKQKDFLKGDYALVYDALSGGSEYTITRLEKAVPFGKTKIRRILTELSAQNLIEVTGTGRGTKYSRK